MPSEVARLVDTGPERPVVQLTGVLDADSLPATRTALLAVLADQPEAVVVDVRAVASVDDRVTGLLRDLAAETADWPGANVVLCATDVAGWRAAGLPVVADPAGALAGLGRPDPGSRCRLTLEPVVGAARRSRELVTEACARWDVPQLADSACIVVTELVNNAVAHARSPMTVLLARRGDEISAAVRDHSVDGPRFTGPVAPTSYGGRGLLLIDSVAHRWGTLRLADGKVVWALLRPEHPVWTPAGRHLGSAGMAGPTRG